MLAEECERLQKELAEVQSVPFEDKAVEVDDIRSALRHYGLVLPKRDVAEMVWEVDEECTGKRAAAQVRSGRRTSLTPLARAQGA